MKHFLLLFVCLAAFPLSAPAQTSTSANRVELPFDDHWQFYKGDVKGAEAPAFDDASWRTLNLPHDWSIEGPYDKANPTGTSGGFLPAGVGWYRKHFTLPADASNRIILIQFDGVMANSQVWINGNSDASHAYGYTPFVIRRTPELLKFDGTDNVIAVRCDNSAQPASRWYSGAGIYRHVHLIELARTFISPFQVQTTNVTSQRADVSFHLNVSNIPEAANNTGELALNLSLTLTAPDGVQTPIDMPQGTIRPGASISLQKSFTINNPVLWDLDHPALYRLTVEAKSGGMTDTQTATFGIRNFEFKPDTGFWLNGKNFKLLGACLHTDGGAVGNAVPLSIYEKRLGSLKSIGFNAIRTAHNPPSPEFLDLCDRMGFVVMDEFFDCWSQPKTNLSDQALSDYHLNFDKDWKKDVTATVARDWNHPSVMLYSAGNEIHDLSNPELARTELLGIRDLVHQIDPTRPVTMAVFRPNVYHAYDNGFSDLLDVIGQNYRENELVQAHKDKPERKILGTENRKEPAAWRTMRDDPAYSGEFFWTGFDYLGETRAWPAITNTAGAFDRTNSAKPQAYQLASWWTQKPMVYMTRILPAPTPAEAQGDRPDPRPFADWSPPAGTSQVKLDVYSNCQEVELLLNDQSLGTRKLAANANPFEWMVQYQPGTIRAVGRNEGTVVAQQTMGTAGAPAKLKLEPDMNSLPNDWDDVAYVRATLLDADNNVVPNASDLVKFAVSGPGAIVGVDNGDPLNPEDYQAAQRHPYRGSCIALVRSSTDNGKLTITATYAGLPPAAITIDAAPPKIRPQATAY